MRRVALGFTLAVAALAAIAAAVLPWPAAAPPPPSGEAPGWAVVGHQMYRADGRALFTPDAPPALLVASDADAFSAEWIRGDDATPIAAGRPIEMAGDAADLPCGARIPLAEPVPREVLAMRIRWHGVPVGEVAVGRAMRPEDLPGMGAVVTARRTGDRAAVEAALSSLPDTAESALWGSVERARVAARAGDWSAARQAWVGAARIAASHGVVSEQARRLNAAAWTALQDRDFPAMDRLTGQARALAEHHDDPRHAPAIAHLRGVLALELGDWRRATAELEHARALARCLGQDGVLRLAVESDALALAELGRHDAAAESLDRLRETLADAEAGTRARFHLNAGWIALRGGRLDAATRSLEHAREVATRPDRRAHIDLNLALAALAAGRIAEARRALDGAVEQGAAEQRRLAVDLTRGEILLAEARSIDALEAFRGVERRSRVELGPDGGDVAWRAEHGIGRALRAQGDLEDAAHAFDRAFVALERQSRRTGLMGARGAFFSERRALVADAVHLALQRGDASAAFAIADRARARVLRSARARLRVQRLNDADRARWMTLSAELAAARDAVGRLRGRADLVAGAARARWRADLTTAEARHRAAFEAAMAVLDRGETVGTVGATGDAIAAALEPGAWLVALVPDGDRWLGLRVTTDGVDHAPVTDDPLGPWRDDLAAADHIHLVTTGHPKGFAVATEPGPDGETPLAVTHGLSWLPYAGHLVQGGAPPAGRLVVADPGHDLPHARREGRWLTARWSSTAGLTKLVGAAATRAAVLSALPTAGVVHFSGHGVLRETHPWQAHLVLNDGRLDVVDVLATRLDGARVVLNGCETGPDALLGRDDVLGLPEAFLAAGAASVVATDRPVPDEDARRFTEAFYSAGGAERPAAALRSVIRTSWRSGSATWSAWRLVGRP